MFFRQHLLGIISMINNIKLKDTLKIIQITDTHLFGHDDQKIFGHDSNNNFIEVIEKIKNNDLFNTDFIILTGDLSQDETANSYLNVMRAMSEFSLPIYWIPGNHDDLGIMNAVFAESHWFSYIKSLLMKYWNFIFLNTKMIDSESGYLKKEEIDHLSKEVINSKLTNKKLAIIMHHHPIRVQTPLIDNYILNNDKVFWDTVKDVEDGLIICGHVHGDYSFRFKNFKIECSPATCFQFEKGANVLKIENSIGYKVHNFNYNEYSSRSVIWEK